MKAVLILHLAVLGLVRAEAKPKVLELELNKVAVAEDGPAVQGELAERGMLSYKIARAFNKYVMGIKVGTPRQRVWVGLHTASTQTWITYQNLFFSEAGFASSKSTSFHLKKYQRFIIKHPILPEERGDVISETVSPNPTTTIENMTLGAVQLSEQLSVGWIGLKVHTPNDPSGQPTFLDYLRTGEFIDRRAYSLYFDPHHHTGRIHFCSVDTTKFIGELAVLTHPHNPGQKSSVFVGLSGVEIAISTSEPSQVSVPAEGVHSILDSSSALSWLPFEIVKQIAIKVGAKPFGVPPLLRIDCRHKRQPNPQERVTLTLPRADGGAPVRINIPLADLVIEPDGKGPSFPGCLFGIQALAPPVHRCPRGIHCPLANNRTAPFAIFGHNFLWHMYMVVDFDSNYIAVAPMNLDPVNLGPDRPANIVELPASSDGIQALRGVNSPNEQGQAPPRAPEDGAADVKVDQPGNSEVMGAGELGDLGTAEARGSGEVVGTSAGAVGAGPRALTS